MNSSIFVVMIFTIRVVKDRKSCQVCRGVCVYVCVYLSFDIDVWWDNVQSLPYIVISYIINQTHQRDLTFFTILFVNIFGKERHFSVLSELGHLFFWKMGECLCMFVKEVEKNWIRISSSCQEKYRVILLFFNLYLKVWIPLICFSLQLKISLWS